MNFKFIIIVIIIIIIIVIIIIIIIILFSSDSVVTKHCRIHFVSSFFSSAGATNNEVETEQDPGNDPDNVAGEELPEQALKAVGVEPGDKHEGSVQSLIEGKKDIEVTSVALTSEQVQFEMKTWMSLVALHWCNRQSKNSQGCHHII